MTPRLRIDRLDSLAALEPLAPAWAALEARTPEATGFQSPDWCLNWARASAARVRVLAIHEDDRLVMLWPLQIERLYGASLACWLGEPMTQYGDVLAEPGAGRARWLAAAREALAGWSDVDLFAFTQLRADGVLAAFEGMGRILEGEPAEAPFVRAGAAVSRRKSMSRRARRLAAMGDVRFIDAGAAGQRERLAREALALKRRWLRGKGFWSAGLSNPSAEAFIARAAREGVMRVYALSVGGEIAAVEIGLIGGGAYRSFLSAFDPKFAEGSPGQTLTRLVVERCVSEGLAGYDLLPPGDAYKRDWASEATPVRAAFLPMTARGVVAGVALAKLRPLAKRIVKGAAKSLSGAGGAPVFEIPRAARQVTKNA